MNKMFGGSETLYGISRGPSDDEFSEHSSIDDKMFGGTLDDDELSDNSSIDEMSGVSNSYNRPSISSSSSKDEFHSSLPRFVVLR